MITEKQLILFAPGSQKVAAIVTKWFNEFACKYEVNTPQRVAAFLAQVIHESGGFRYLREIASGQAYEGRKDLGNVFPGDGVRYKGRGYLQTTGRNNYATVSIEIFGDDTLLKNPDLLATPKYGMLSALLFWQSRGLNRYADMPVTEKVLTKAYGYLRPYAYITYRINGGLTHINERIRIYNVICKEFGLPQYVSIKVNA